MLRENYLKHKDVLEAWANGAEIEQRFGLQPWEPVGDRILQMGDDFRIKPEDRYIPFDKSDISFLRGKWVKFKENPAIQFQITCFNDVEDIMYVGYGCDVVTLLEYYIFEDGKPCGKIKNS